MPVLVGTKFDDFVQLPLDLQWTIANQVMNVRKTFGLGVYVYLV